MRGLVLALAMLVVTSAVADDLQNQIDGRHDRRAFWLNDQAWPITRPDSANKQPSTPFTKTYMDGVAKRFSISAGGHVDLFERKFGGVSGLPAPSVVGTFDHGAAMLEMRWHPGE